MSTISRKFNIARALIVKSAIKFTTTSPAHYLLVIALDLLAWTLLWSVFSGILQFIIFTAGCIRTIIYLGFFLIYLFAPTVHQEIMNMLIKKVNNTIYI